MLLIEEGNMKKKSIFTKGIELKLDILQRHLQLLNTLQKNEPAGIVKLSKLTECPQHQVRVSLRMLEQEGLIEPSRSGAITTDTVHGTITLLKMELKDINKTVNKLIKTLK